SGEEVERLGGRGALGLVDRWALGLVRRRRHVGGRATHAGEDLLLGARHSFVPLSRVHHWRKDSVGGVGTSRASLHAPSPGTERTVRSPMRRPATLAAFCAPARRLGSESTHCAARSAADSVFGRSCSTTRPRISTSRSGMLIFTGHTS